MKKSVEYGTCRVVRPDDGEIMTVRELIEILSECNPDAWVIVGTGLNDCEDNIARIILQPDRQDKPGVVLLATEPDEPEDRED